MKEVSVYRVHMEKVGSFIIETDAIAAVDSAWRACKAFLDHCLGGHLTDREYFGALWLNTKNRITGAEMVSIGSLNATIVSPRELFKGAVLHNAASMIIFHSHPSGDPTPSPEDIRITRRVAECGELIGIELLDHIVLGDEGRYTSLKSEGVL